MSEQENIRWQCLLSLFSLHFYSRTTNLIFISLIKLKIFWFSVLKSSLVIFRHHWGFINHRPKYGHQGPSFVQFINSPLFSQRPSPSRSFQGHTVKVVIQSFEAKDSIAVKTEPVSVGSCVRIIPEKRFCII